MNILMVTARYAPFTGGVERHVEKVAASLLALGHEVTVLTLTNGKALPAHEIVHGVSVWRLKATGMSRKTQVAAGTWALRHRRLLRNFDVIHGHDVYLRALKGMAPNVPQYMTFHGYEGWPIQPEAIERRHKMEEAVRKKVCAGAFIGKWY